MSQPRDENVENDPRLKPIAHLDELLTIFTRFEKPESQFRIGVEHERFIINPQTLIPVPWEGDAGIHSVMRKLLKRFKTENSATTEGEEAGQLVAIMRPKSSITLEPGCQLELSGEPLATIFDIDDELARYESILEDVLAQTNLKSLLMGFHPTARQDDFSWVPKKRYEIMRAYMEKTGTRGHDMMLRTCTVQANFDYSSEAEMIESFRLALLASPIITALFASSPFKEGKPSGFLSERTIAWHETDPDRCGFPLEVFESQFSYRQWIERVIDTPMYFVRRSGIYHDATSITFRQFLKKGFLGFKACIRDFEDHMTTIFTDTRIKPQLEVRSADCGSKPFLRALPAFWKGLLYDETSRTRALSLLSTIDPAMMVRHQIDAGTFGLDARFGDKDLGVFASDLVGLSREGLQRHAQKNEPRQDESIYLSPLDEVIARGKNTAQLMLERFHAHGESFSWLLDAP